MVRRTACFQLIMWKITLDLLFKVVSNGSLNKNYLKSTTSKYFFHLWETHTQTHTCTKMSRVIRL